MSIRRCCALTLCLFAAMPGMAQGNDARPAAQASGGAPEILIEGSAEKKSDWKRAETEHVVVFSNGREAELVRTADDLERLYRLLSRIYRRGDLRDDTVKLQIAMFDSTRYFQEMGLKNLLWEEGPYPAVFANQRYYDARDDGDVIAVARVDQTVDLDTTRANNLDCDEQLAAGAFDCSAPLPVHLPTVRPWESLLYSAFAQHFLLTYTQAAYPRWYLDGVGALFSTTEMRKDGRVDYARPPEAFLQYFRSYGDPDIGEVLSGHYLDPASKATWSPYHAWLIAHYFLYSKLTPERSRQFAQYMRAIHQGMPMDEAAKVFGSIAKLQREIMAYARDRTRFARTEPLPAIEGDPLVTTLSMSSAAAFQKRLELGARLAEPSGAEAWLAHLRDDVARLPFDTEALLVLAEAECRSEHRDACLATAEQVLAKSPDNARALGWKGVALTDKAIAGPAADRAAALTLARKTIARAISIDGEAPAPLAAYFQSFTKAGERPTETAMLAMAKAIRLVPAAPGPRLLLGEELTRQGQASLARSVLYPLLYGADNAPEKRAAAALFTRAGSGPPTGLPGAP
ncbi:MAG TPA: hypothetical protein VGE65_00110 [Sphingobium sp.]